MTMTAPKLITTDGQVDTSVTVELSTPSLTHEWLQDGRVFRTTLHDSSRQTVDQYASRWMEVIGNMRAGSTIYFILDISKVAFTIYGRTRSLELARFRKDVKGYVAIVEKNSIESHFSQMIVRTIDRDTSNVRVRLFHTMDEAFHWFDQMGQVTHSPATE
jgi:hypothetical protein